MAVFHLTMTWLAWLLCLLSLTAQAASLDRVCQQLLSQYSNLTTLAGNNTQYTALAEENWSQTAWGYPSCIVQPANAAQVQGIVRLVTEHQVPFAIRSGGHLPSPLGANINRGVLVDTSFLKTLDYDATNEVVTIGAGLRWRVVYAELEKYGRTAVGGRIMDVGVSGLLLGSTFNSTSYRLYGIKF